MPTTFSKDSGSTLDYGVDWAKWLDGDTITASTWTAEDGITVTTSTNTTTRSTVWLTGGTTGQAYALTNRIVTAAGRTDERTIRIVVRER